MAHLMTSGGMPSSPGAFLVGRQSIALLSSSSLGGSSSSDMERRVSTASYAVLVTLQPKKMHRAKPPGTAHVDISQTFPPHRLESYTSTLSRAFTSRPSEGDAQQQWGQLRDSIYSSLSLAFGRKKSKSQGWFEANASNLTPLLEEKQAALLAHKQNPTPATQQALKSAHSQAQRSARRCANDYWLELCSNIQRSADSRNIRGVSTGTRKPLGRPEP